LLAHTPDIRLVDEARRGGEVMNLVRRSAPDALLLDLFLEPEFDARAAVRSLRAFFPSLIICIISAHLEPTWIRELLQAGIYGYILKDDDYVSQIDGIVHDLADGIIYLGPQAHDALTKVTRAGDPEKTLSEREVEILRPAQRGLPNPQIALSLHISGGTVHNHLSTIYSKLGVHSRREALQAAREHRLI
jgi:two-component system response regulator DesR